MDLLYKIDILYNSCVCARGLPPYQGERGKEPGASEPSYPHQYSRKTKSHLCVCDVGSCCFGSDIDVGGTSFGVVCRWHRK